MPKKLSSKSDPVWQRFETICKDFLRWEKLHDSPATFDTRSAQDRLKELQTLYPSETDIAHFDEEYGGFITFHEECENLQSDKNYRMLKQQIFFHDFCDKVDALYDELLSLGKHIHEDFFSRRQNPQYLMEKLERIAEVKNKVDNFKHEKEAKSAEELYSVVKRIKSIKGEALEQFFRAS